MNKPCGCDFFPEATSNTKTYLGLPYHESHHCIERSKHKELHDVITILASETSNFNSSVRAVLNLIFNGILTSIGINLLHTWPFILKFPQNCYIRNNTRMKCMR